MKLSQYLKDQGENPDDFARRIGASIFACRKWLRGERIPRPGWQSRIRDATAGAVNGNDWIPEGTYNDTAKL